MISQIIFNILTDIIIIYFGVRIIKILKSIDDKLDKTSNKTIPIKKSIEKRKHVQIYDPEPLIPHIPKIPISQGFRNTSDSN